MGKAINDISELLDFFEDLKKWRTERLRSKGFRNDVIAKEIRVDHELSMHSIQHQFEKRLLSGYILRDHVHLK